MMGRVMRSIAVVALIALLPRVTPAGDQKTFGNEIIVLDPGVDAKGEPRPVLRRSADGGYDVDIPPSVHVHRYFPSGVRQFRAQYFAGGPTIVSVRHPFCDQRVNVQLDLPPGFPTIRYGKAAIEYKYPDESHTVHFEPDGGVTTSYSRCGVVRTTARKAAGAIVDRSCDLAERLGVAELANKVADEAVQTADGATKRTRQFVSQSGNLLITAANMTPGVQLIQSATEDRAQAARDRAVRRVTRQRERADRDIRTLR